MPRHSNGGREPRLGLHANCRCTINLGYKVARGTVANILKRNGVEPAPERNRKTTWKEFLTHHWDLIVAADFFTIDVWTAKGLQRFIVLFFSELLSRRVEIGGISAAANGLWISQVARNVTGSVDVRDQLGHSTSSLAYFCSTLVPVNSSRHSPYRFGRVTERFANRSKQGCL